MPVTCPEFEQRLHESLDVHAMDLPAEVQAHATECATCCQLLADWKRTEAAIAVWKIVEPPSGLRGLIVARLHSERRPELVVSRPATAMPPLGSAGVIAAMLAAAALMLMLGIGWRASQATTVARLELSRTVVVDKSRAIEPEPDLQNLLHDAREAYAALASEAWQQVSVANGLLPLTNIPRLPADDSLRPVPDSLARPLAPIRTELREAWDSLMDRVFSNSQDSST